MRKALLFCGVIATVSCAPLPPIAFLPDADLAPPVVVGLRFRSAAELEIGFDEEVSWIAGPESPDSVEVEDVAVEHSEDDPVAQSLAVVRFSAPPSPAAEHYVEAQVADVAGNHLRFVARFYGLNPFMPAMLINEFTTQGSGRNPDLVELRILTDGNLAGATLFEGVPGNWDKRFIFPSFDVVAGDYVVVHFRPQGIDEEIDETSSPDVSGGYNATPTGWDFWVRDGSGLSGNNGVIALTENPLGGYIDAVLYSNRTSESDERYRGFGSGKTMDRADELAAAGAWGYEGPAIAPEDAIDPDPSTGTRSMARGSAGTDTDHASDWHTTPTRGITPGAENTDEVHVP